MESWIAVIQQAELFMNLRTEDIKALLVGLQAKKKRYAKGEFLFYAGEEIRHIGIVLSGAVHVVQEDYWGNRNILAQIQPGGMFGEAFACLPGSLSTVGAVAAEESEVMRVRIDDILHCHMAAQQEQLVMNLLALVARRNLLLTQKIRCVSQRSTRRKIMTYLSDEARRQGDSSFSIPFNRQELADFLSVDRSAMSAELSKMQREGLISYRRDTFTLYSGEA